MITKYPFTSAWTQLSFPAISVVYDIFNNKSEKNRQYDKSVPMVPRITFGASKAKCDRQKCGRWIYKHEESDPYVELAAKAPQNIVAAFKGMHVSPAKHSYASVTDGWTDRRTDRQTTDKVIRMCRYASQATQKSQFTTDLMISVGLMISALVHMKAILPYCPSIRSCRRKFSPSKSLAVLSSIARWIEDTTHTTVHFLRY